MTRRFLVSGQVQGVGYRWFAYRAARALGLGGYVRNQGDGSVEVVAHGSASAVEALGAQLREGPRGASVTNVEIVEISDEAVSVSRFDIIS